MPGEIQRDPTCITFPPLGGRSLRVLASVVLILGGAVRAITGGAAGAWFQLLAGVVAVVFGVVIARTLPRAGTTVTPDGWHDPTRLRNQRLAWSDLDKVRVTSVGDTATWVLEPRGDDRSPGLRVARTDLASVPDTVAQLRSWAEDHDVEVVDLTGR
ncbi:MAG: hypothetical protein ACLFRD_04800 [Nitriliruptoraceae bacterium]